MKPKRDKKTYNVKVYHCDGCGHIFHTAKSEKIEFCNKCEGGKVKIVDRYKSKRLPRGSPRRGQPWLTSELFMKERKRGVIE